MEHPYDEIRKSEGRPTREEVDASHEDLTAANKAAADAAAASVAAPAAAAGKKGKPSDAAGN